MKDQIEYYKKELSSKEALLQLSEARGLKNNFMMVEYIKLCKKIITDLEEIDWYNGNIT